MRAALRVVLDAPAVVNPVDAAVGPTHAHLQVERPGLHRAGEGRLELLHVFREDVLAEDAGAPRLDRPRVAENLVVAEAGARRPGRQVNVPRAERGGFEREFEARARLAQRLFGAHAARDFEEGDDDALDALFGRAVREQAHQVPAAAARVYLALDGVEAFEHLLGVLDQPAAAVVVELRGEVGERAAGVGRDEVEDVARARRVELDAQGAVEEDRADVGRVHQVEEVVVRLAQLLDLDLQLLIDGRQLLVRRL